MGLWTVIPTEGVKAFKDVYPYAYSHIQFTYFRYQDIMYVYYEERFVPQEVKREEKPRRVEKASEVSRGFHFIKRPRFGAPGNHTHIKTNAGWQRWGLAKRIKAWYCLLNTPKGFG